MKHNEESWALVGKIENKMWVARRKHATLGDPHQVEMDYKFVLDRWDMHRDIIGFMHTHIGCDAMPSKTDINTMRAWVACLGFPLVCVIQGVDKAGNNELRCFWFANDESEPKEYMIIQMDNVLAGVFPL